ncbi:unnamed protein product [Amoebophrya sp. A120]|nr:unnamed protein product [Amoebophrya sp. A120]|eukprot:GSA120T00007409001.1
MAGSTSKPTTPSSIAEAWKNGTLSLDMVSKTAVLQYLLVINILTFFIYGLDKCCAKFSNSLLPKKLAKSMFGSMTTRLAESVLLTFTLIGGSPAAFFAMQIFRHKTLKTSFQFQFNLIVLVHLAGVGFVLYSRDIFKT